MATGIIGDRQHRWNARAVDIAEIWDAWATDVRSATIDCGHHVTEEKLDELATILLDFLAT